MTVVLALTAAFLLVGAARVHWALAWIACALLASAVRGANRRAAAVAGGLFATSAGLVLTVPWVGETTAEYFSISPTTGVTLAALMMVAYGTTWGAALGIGLRGALRLRSGIAIPFFGAVWAAWEAAQLAVFPHHPWLSLAAAHAVDGGLILQIASLGGQALITAVAAAGGCAAALALRRRRVGAWAVTVALVGASLAWGGWRIATAERMDAACNVVTLDAGILPGTPRDVTIERYMDLTRDIGDNRPDAVVWPESALPSYIEQDTALRRALRSLAASTETVLIAGGPRLEWDRRWQKRLYNSAYRIPAQGPLGIYDKRALAPFAEDWPGAGSLRPGWARADQVEAGHRAAVFDAGACRFGMMLCFESDHPWVARSAVEAGATSLLVLSNDAQLTRSAIEAEIAQARLRAVETGLPLLRAANRGTTVAIDRYGRAGDAGGGGALRVSLSSGTPALAVRSGPLVLLACAVCAAVAVGRGLLPQ